MLEKGSFCLVFVKVLLYRGHEEAGVSSMSKIWEALREAQRLRKQGVEDGGPHNYWDGIRDIRDRRSTKRLSTNVPVWIYGYGATDVPFHERTEALSVNASGGLITLTTAVNSGQTLLLINELNLKEEKCTVVREVSTSDRTDIAVKFSQPLPDFWDTAIP